MMRYLRKRYIALFALVVMISSLLSFFLSGGLGAFIGSHTADREVRMIATIALRELLTPAFSLLFIGAVIAFITKRMASPIETICAATQEIAAGNFAVRLPELSRKDEVGQLSEHFNRMAAELQANEYMRKDFISNVSHEFTTPLAVIEGYAALLDSEALDETERRRYAGVIRRECERLSGLTQNILLLSKLENQSIHEQPTLFPLDEQLRQAIVFLEPKWAEKGLRFAPELRPVTCRGNADLLWLAWMNLLGNAIKFSQPGGMITVRLTAGGGEARVVIRDHGVGMDEATRCRACEQFFQGEHSHTHEGSGLGLALTKRIVELHQGSLALSSAPGRGTTASVRLPGQPAAPGGADSENLFC